MAAAIGMACGAGLLPLAAFATLLHFVAILIVAPLRGLIPQSGDRSSITVTYEDGRGALRGVLARAATLGCQTTLINTQQETLDGVKVVRARLRFRFGPPLGDIMAQISELPGVVGVDMAPALRKSSEKPPPTTPVCLQCALGSDSLCARVPGWELQI